MTSRTTKEFRRLLQSLPREIQQKAREAYKIWNNDPRHPSLHFKKVHAELPIWSVRVTQNYRAVGIVRGEVMLWFWIGDHDGYARILRSL